MKTLDYTIQNLTKRIEALQNKKKQFQQEYLDRVAGADRTIARLQKTLADFKAKEKDAKA